MLFSRIISSLLLLLVTASASVLNSHSWPNGPFTTSGRYMKDASGNTVTYAGVNWPGAADTMLPEGLQYQSVATIVSKVKSLGMNVIRLTYAIQLIDDIYNGVDLTLNATLHNALGPTNGTKVLKQILNHNPKFSPSTTKLEVFDAVAAECAKQEIYVHLDNHVSKAEWCCSHTDGNAWFGDIYFNITNWKRGLSYMAKHAKAWPALTSMSLRNELRYTDNSTAANATYDWSTWYTNIVAGANAIHAANPKPLIFFSGLNYDTSLQPVTALTSLGNGHTFSLQNFSYRKKIVFELHNYENGVTNCHSLESELYDDGYNAMDTNGTTTAKNIAPVVMTEFGFPQNGSAYMQTYASCLKSYLTEVKGGWMQWVLAGSYYIREGVQDTDETWGLLNHDWSDWRSPTTVNKYTKPMVLSTLS